MVFPLLLCYDSDMNKYYFCSIARLWIPIHFWLLAQCESVKKLLWCGFLTLLKLTPISYRYEKDVSKVKKITWSWSKFIWNNFITMSIVFLLLLVTFKATIGLPVVGGGPPLARVWISPQLPADPPDPRTCTHSPHLLFHQCCGPATLLGGSGRQRYWRASLTQAPAPRHYILSFWALKNEFVIFYFGCSLSGLKKAAPALCSYREKKTRLRHRLQRRPKNGGSRLLRLKLWLRNTACHTIGKYNTVQYSTTPSIKQCGGGRFTQRLGILVKPERLQPQEGRKHFF